MAEATVLLVSSDARSNPKSSRAGFTGIGLQGRKLTKFGPLSANDGDTVTTGITNIVEVAWASDSGASDGATSWTAAGVVTINTSALPTVGTLYVWSGGS